MYVHIYMDCTYRISIYCLFTRPEKTTFCLYLYNDICQDTRQDKIGSDEVYDAEQ